MGVEGMEEVDSASWRGSYVVNYGVCLGSGETGRGKMMSRESRKRVVEPLSGQVT